MVDFQNLTDEEFIIQNGFLSKERALKLAHLSQRVDRFCDRIDDILKYSGYDNFEDFVFDVQNALDEMYYE